MRTVYFHWSASEVLRVTFIKWQRRLYPKDHTGKRKPGWWGVGSIVYSSWAFRWDGAKRVSRKEKLKPGYIWLAPHTELYRTYDGAWSRRGRTIKRPTMKEYIRNVRRRNRNSKALA